MAETERTRHPPYVGDDERGLDGQQQNITSRYKKFEKKLLQLAEFLRENDTERAELLKRAYGQSRDDNISNSLERITALLTGEKRLGDAVGAQTEVVVNLQALLLLLQSDDLKYSIAQEKARIKDLLKDLRGVIGKHKRSRTANERGEAAERVAGKQEAAAKKARELVKKIDGQDAGKQAEGDQDGKPKDGKGKGSGGTRRVGAGQLGEGGLGRLLVAQGAGADKRDSLAGMSARDYAQRDNRTPGLADALDAAKSSTAKPTGPVQGPVF